MLKRICPRCLCMRVSELHWILLGSARRCMPNPLSEGGGDVYYETLIEST